MKKKKIGVYLIKNNMTLRVRVGSAKDINKRFSNYRAKLRGGNGNKLMQQDFNEYGEGSFEFIILEECKVSELFEKEKKWMKEYADCINYNVNKIKNVNKKVRRGIEAKNYKEKRSKITSGENNGHNTKLSEQDVIKIKYMLEDGVKQNIITDKFNISPGLVSNIKKGRRWASVKIDKEKVVPTAIDTTDFSASTNALM